MEELSHLYRVAGVPVKATRAFRKTLADLPPPEHCDRMAGIYPGGRR